MKAIILAAGQGTRLRPLTDNKPKCMVEFQGKPVIDYLIETFNLCGIDDIVVVNGYQGDMLESHLEGQNIRFVRNENYDTTNMLHSLFCAENEMNDDLIISYSDIIFSPKALQTMINSKKDISVAIDSEWEKLWRIRMEDYISDVETLKMDSEGAITEIGQSPKSIKDIQGQYIGLIRVEKNKIQLIKNCYKILKNKNKRERENLFMTDFLQFLINEKIEISSEMIAGGWIEIDTVEDLDNYNKDLNKLPVWEWQYLIEDVKEIAKIAGRKIKHHQGKGEIRIKKDNSPVTDADILANQIIEVGLNALDIKYPILSEERVSKNIWEKRKDWATYWLIDPIDGTKEYIKGRKDYTVNIALIHKNKPVLGVVYVPADEEIYYASKNWGSFKEDLKTNQIKLLKESNPAVLLRVITSRSHKNPRLQRFLKKIPPHRIISMGSSLKLCKVADGKADIYPRLGPLSEWDISAAAMILKEAGGQIYNFEGELITFDTVDGRINSFIAVSKHYDNIILNLLQKQQIT